MILNYLKLSFRLMARNPFFTAINVVGLSVGFAVFFVLWQHSQIELNSDRQWKDWERIAFLGFKWEWTDDGKNWDNKIFMTNQTAISSKLDSDYPEIESFTRIIYQESFSPEFTGLSNQVIVSIEDGNKSKAFFKEENMICADTNVFGFFGIPFETGDPKTALRRANSAVIDQSTATKYFGNRHAVGQSILINNILFEITGIFRDLPKNTQLDFSIVISNQDNVNYWNVDHPFPNCDAYLKSKQIISWKEFENKINQPEAKKKYWGEILSKFTNSKVNNQLYSLVDVPFHLNQGGHKSKVLLYSFQLIGALVLILAVVNYVILSFSRMASRLKEVATRKISGAATSDLFNQFFIETLVIFSISLLLSFTIIQLLKTPLNIWLDLPVHPIALQSFIIFLTAVSISITICTVYPVQLSRAFQLTTLLKKLKTNPMRKGFTLLVIQYSIAIALFVWSFAVYNQISFLIKQDLGFNKENKIVIDGPVTDVHYENNVKTYMDKLVKIKGVGSISSSVVAMGDGAALVSLRRPGIDNLITIDSPGGIDENFIPLHDLTLIEGRNFMPNETSNVIILSEGALLRLGFSNPAGAVGSVIDVLSTGIISGGDEWIKTEIIGIIKPYRVRSLFYRGNEDDKNDRGIGLTYGSTLVKSFLPKKITIEVQPENFKEVMDHAQKEYEASFPGNIFTWRFLDENVNRHYQKEKVWRNQILVFTCLAIGIACLGLLGMISNKVVEKTKEIGIRKVLGADLHQIAKILLKTSFQQILLATIIGIPVAHYLTQQYLQKFSVQIRLHWWHYTLPLVMLAFIMLSSVATVVWKAAISNPVESLKQE